MTLNKNLSYHLVRENFSLFQTLQAKSVITLLFPSYMNSYSIKIKFWTSSYLDLTLNKILSNGLVREKIFTCSSITGKVSQYTFVSIPYEHIYLIKSEFGTNSFLDLSLNKNLSYDLVREKLLFFKHHRQSQSIHFCIHPIWTNIFYKKWILSKFLPRIDITQNPKLRPGEGKKTSLFQT